jgi:TPR repeat protein
MRRGFLPLLAALAAMVAASPGYAMDRPDEENVLTCSIAGQDREASLSIAGDRVVYRYGPPGQRPELTLSAPLGELDYRRRNGAGDTIDETATFANGDTLYRFEAGFRDGAAPDPSALHPFGTLTVSRNGQTLAGLTCRPDSIRRKHDRLLALMREIGRERGSDGQSFPNYAIQYPLPASRSPPCEADFNVDTCWSRGVAAARGGDLRAALDHYDMSCAAGFDELGCYEAGKLYLHNRALRDYGRAQARLTHVCDSDDPGRGPYACKYLGWMYLTGTGTGRDLDKAWSHLSKACFLHNDALMIDPEGCHFFAQTVRAAQAAEPRRFKTADFLTYVALAQGCTDNARTVCDEAREMYRTAAARGAEWIGRCENAVRSRGLFPSCAQMTTVTDDYEATMAARRNLMAVFLQALDTE